MRSKGQGLAGLALLVLGGIALAKSSSPSPSPAPVPSPTPVPVPTPAPPPIESKIFRFTIGNQFIYWLPWGSAYPGLNNSYYPLYMATVRGMNFQASGYTVDIYSYPQMLFQYQTTLPFTLVDQYAKSP